MWDEVAKKSLETLAGACPWLSHVAGIVCIVLAITATAVLICRMRHPTTFSLLGGLFKWTTKDPDEQLVSSIQKLERDADTKTSIMFLVKLFIRDYGDFLAAPSPQRYSRLHSMVLASLSKTVRAKGEHRCSVMVPTEDGNHLSIAEGCGFTEKERKHTRLAINRSCAGEAFRSHELYYCKDTREDRNWVRNPSSSHDYLSVVCVPLIVGEQAFGVLSVDATEANAFSNDDLATLGLFASCLSVLLASAKILHLYEEGYHEDDGKEWVAASSERLQ